MSAIVPPSDSKTDAAEFGLKAMKKIKNAIPSQVRTFLIMAGLLLWVRVTVSAAAILMVSASSLGVNNVAEKPIPYVQVKAVKFRLFRADRATALRTPARTAPHRRDRAVPRAPRGSSPRLRATLPHRATFLWPHSRRRFDPPGT